MHHFLHLTICLLMLPLSDYGIMITFSILRSLVTLCSRINILSQPCSFHHCSISHPDDLFLHQVPSHWTTLWPIHVYTSQSFPLMPKQCTCSAHKPRKLPFDSMHMLKLPRFPFIQAGSHLCSFIH